MGSSGAVNCTEIAACTPCSTKCWLISLPSISPTGRSDLRWALAQCLGFTNALDRRWLMESSFPLGLAGCLQLAQHQAQQSDPPEVLG